MSYDLATIEGCAATIDTQAEEHRKHAAHYLQLGDFEMSELLSTQADALTQAAQKIRNLAKESKP